MTVAVLASDGSFHSLLAARKLIEPGLFAPPLHVHLVHVSPELTGRPRAYFSKEVLDEWVEEAAAHAFVDLLPVLEPVCASVSTHRLVGDAAAMICALAKTCSADVIVMGTHGRGAFLAAVIGSVASHVVAHAPVPVLLVRTRPDSP
jgi:nucleotide-binding universal stress UspA family protein